MTRTLSLAFAALLLTIAASAPAQEIPAELQYDAARPLDVRVLRSTSRGSIRIDEIEYASPLGGPVPAIVVTPANGRRNAAVVFGHWGLGDRHTFLEEAVDLAARGAVSLLVDSVTVRPAPWGKPGDAQYGEALVQNVVDLRRGVDLLVARDDVDPRRLAYAGLSMGAHAGGILAGVERRFAGFVLMGGTAQFSEFLRQGPYRRNLPADQAARFDAWVARVTRLDARNFVRHAAPARVFLQFTVGDEYVPLSEARAYYEAASEPKLMKWYDGGHELAGRARIDRAEWLRTVIGIDDLSPADDERIAAAASEAAKLALVMDVPGMQHVPVRRDAKVDVYLPFGIQAGRKVPAVIVHDAESARDGRAIVSAARLIAANAQRAAIVSGDRDLAAVVEHVRRNADALQVNGNSIAVWSRSGAAPPAGIRAYAGFNPAPEAVERATVPAFVVTSGDVPQLPRFRAAASRGAITHRHLEHSQRAFDVLDDTEASRGALRDTIQFLRRNLPVRGEG